MLVGLRQTMLETEPGNPYYYPEYAFNHPLMTDDMRIYSDSKVSDFLSRTTTDQRIRFLNEWNEKFEDKIDQMGKKLKECMGLPVRPRGDFIKYFDLVYWHEGLEDEKFMSGIERTEIINREIQLCGYFVIRSIQSYS